MKYDDYEMAAIYREGSDGWPSQWEADCDESFQKYKAAVDKGQKVSATPFLAAQKLIYKKKGTDCVKSIKKQRFRRSTRRWKSKRGYKK